MSEPEKRTQRRPQPPKMSDEEFESFYREIYQEFGPAKSKQDEDLTKDIPQRRGQAAKAPAPVPQPGTGTNRNTYTDSSRVAAPVRKDNSIKALTIAVCLECLGIVCVVLWWVVRIL